MVPKKVEKRASKFVEVLGEKIPSNIDGKEAILELKEADYNWRQMEWIGWYFEYKAQEILMNEFGGSDGPSYENTTFDYQLNHVYDMKAHTSKGRDGYNRNVMILNDMDAIRKCVRKEGGIGFIVAHGIPEYDDEDRSFYHWHEELKGGESEYVKRRKERDAPSRDRKKEFDLERLDVYYIPNVETLNMGMEESWLGQMDQGRNADGSERPPKFKMYSNRIPDEYIPATKSMND